MFGWKGTEDAKGTPKEAVWPTDLSVKSLKATEERSSCVPSEPNGPGEAELVSWRQPKCLAEPHLSLLPRRGNSPPKLPTLRRLEESLLPLEDSTTRSGYLVAPYCTVLNTGWVIVLYLYARRRCVLVPYPLPTLLLGRIFGPPLFFPRFPPLFIGSSLRFLGQLPPT